MQMRMRQAQAGFVHPPLAMQQQVQIQSARSPALLAAAIAAMPAFDPQQCIE